MIPALREKDANGRDLAPIWAMFSDEEIAAAKQLARAHNARPYIIDEDPAGQGWRFLRDAMIVMRGRDPGALYRETPARRETAARKAAGR